MTITLFTYAFLAGLLPSLIWLFFWLREDSNAEPRPLLIACFIGGMLAVIAAVFAEKYIAETISDQTLLYSLWAAFEEIAKFVTVAVIALHSGYNDEPIDAMIYCITVALGFAALENTLFIMGSISGGQVTQGIITGNMRFVGATLVHVVSAAAVGFCLGWAYYRGYVAKLLALIVGLGGAIAIHTAFNLSIVTGGSSDTLKAFGWIWGAVVILIILFEEVKAVKPKFL
jgi:RsiW-degrading membrane proteinase PrsW (M82 family)